VKSFKDLSAEEQRELGEKIRLAVVDLLPPDTDFSFNFGVRPGPGEKHTGETLLHGMTVSSLPPRLMSIYYAGLYLRHLHYRHDGQPALLNELDAKTRDDWASVVEESFKAILPDDMEYILFLLPHAEDQTGMPEDEVRMSERVVLLSSVSPEGIAHVYDNLAAAVKANLPNEEPGQAPSE
jgi:hypothetical protein